MIVPKQGMQYVNLNWPRERNVDEFIQIFTKYNICAKVCNTYNSPRHSWRYLYVPNYYRCIPYLYSYSLLGIFKWHFMTNIKQWYQQFVWKHMEIRKFIPFPLLTCKEILKSDTLFTVVAIAIAHLYRIPQHCNEMTLHRNVLFYRLTPTLLHFITSHYTQNRCQKLLHTGQCVKNLQIKQRINEFISNTQSDIFSCATLQSCQPNSL